MKLKVSLILAILVAFALTPATVQAAGSESSKKDAGFTDLFNGKDLDNWTALAASGETVAPEDSDWTVEDGIIRCSGEKRNDYWLAPEGMYGNFILKLDYKLTEGANSGVFLRVPTPPGHPAFTGCEIQIVDDVGDDPNAHSSGSLYDVLTPMRNMSNPIGEWNSMEITLRGPRLSVRLNGFLVIQTSFADMKEPIGKYDFPYSELPKEGLLGVQNHGGELWFRNVKLKTLEGGKQGRKKKGGKKK